MAQLLDLTGKTYGWLVPQYYDRKQRKWFCKCTRGGRFCKRKAFIRRATLQNGDSTSCGCYRKELISARSVVDLTGCRFGRLRIIKMIKERRYQKVVWECLCDPTFGGCGKTVEVIGNNLRHTQSCGCLQSELSAKKVAAVRHLVNTPKAKAKHRKAVAKYQQHPKNRARNSRMNKRLWQTLEHRVKVESGQARADREKFRSKQRANMQRLWQDPKYRRRMVVASRRPRDARKYPLSKQQVVAILERRFIQHLPLRTISQEFNCRSVKHIVAGRAPRYQRWVKEWKAKHPDVISFEGWMKNREPRLYQEEVVGVLEQAFIQQLTRPQIAANYKISPGQVGHIIKNRVKSYQSWVDEWKALHPGVVLGREKTKQKWKLPPGRGIRACADPTKRGCVE